LYIHQISKTEYFSHYDEKQIRIITPINLEKH